jgi:ATP-dependent Clp protease ATP-binding subunit ClpA
MPARAALPRLARALPAAAPTFRVGHFGFGALWDAIVAFARLKPETIHRVVDKFVLELERQLADRQVAISVSDEARTWLAEKGYDELYGARPLARVIQENIKKPLADELLFGRLAKGGSVRVKVENGKLGFDFAVVPPPALPKPSETALVE